ncbi:hypothetical protein N9R54_02135 [Pelobium sp.]|nr:hypothetical protein [Pelobium sp.]MDA9555011.1 hypothetical protein [Pelobium sp.]
MRKLKFLNLKAGLVITALTLSISGLESCAPKLTSPNLTKLQGREAVLALNTELNNLKLALEKENLRLSSLQNDVNKANDDASKSAAEAKELSDKLSSNPGDLKLSSKANKAAKEAARDAKKAAKLNDALGKSNGKIKEYQKDIEEAESKIKDLESKIEFVPNTTNQ